MPDVAVSGPLGAPRERHPGEDTVARDGTPPGVGVYGATGKQGPPDRLMAT
jgi:hypothetical protein